MGQCGTKVMVQLASFSRGQNMSFQMDAKNTQMKTVAERS